MITTRSTIQNSKPELIFVTDITDYIPGEKVSCGEISAFYTEFEQFMEFLSNFMQCLFQIYVEKNLCGENMCGEKMTNMRSEYSY